MKWRVGEFLEQHGITRYALAKKADLSMKTAYALAKGNLERMDFATMAKVIRALEELTGKRVEPNDVLEVIRDEGDAKDPETEP